MAHQDGTIKVVLAADANYVMPAAVTMTSLVTNAAVDDEHEIVLLCNNISADDKALLEQSCGNASLTMIEISSSALEAVNPVYHLTPTAFARFLIPDLVAPSWTRALYLDCDTVVLGSLDALWRADLEGCPVGAVLDDPVLTALFGAGPEPPSGRRLSSTQHFNSGVLLIDLSAWRRDRTGQRAMEYARRTGTPDQYALNHVVGTNWKRLDQVWNQMTPTRMRAGRHERVPAASEPEGGIWHFVIFKPWQYKFRAMTGAQLFFDCLDRTPWRGWRPTEDIEAVQG